MRWTAGRRPVSPSVVVRDGGPARWFHGHGVADTASKVADHPGHRVPDWVHHQDLHRDRRHATVGAGAVGAGRTGERLSPHLPASRPTPVSGRPPCDTCSPTPPESVTGDGSRTSSGRRRLGVRAGRSCRPSPTTTAGAFRWRSNREPSGCTATTDSPPRPDRRGRHRPAPSSLPARPRLPTLGYGDTDLRSRGCRPDLATGYVLRSRGLRPVVDRDVLACGRAPPTPPRPTWRATSPPCSPRRQSHGSMLKPATLASMFHPYFHPTPGAGHGAGVPPGRQDGHRTVGHDGIVSGFLSQMTMHRRRHRGRRPRPTPAASTAAARRTVGNSAPPPPARPSAEPSAPTSRPSETWSRDLRVVQPGPGSGHQPVHPGCSWAPVPRSPFTAAI